MLSELIRGLREIIEAEQVRHLTMHALQHLIRDLLPHLWHWAKDHIGEIWDIVSDWF